LRFAPSPNGALHLGHALSACLNVEAARRLSGRFLLRIEDSDHTRSTSSNIDKLMGDLAWLGLDWERPERRQSDHMADYAAALDRLKQQGLVYPCFASRSEIAAATRCRPDWPNDPDGSPLYPGLWRQADKTAIAARQAAGDLPAWRLDMARASDEIGTRSWREFGSVSPRIITADPAGWGDVVLARKDVATSYHLSVVVDDASQDITHVIRGHDLFHATSLHRLLQHLLGLPQPTYLHHRLITGPDGRKLSKSLGAQSLAGLRAGGTTPAGILHLIDWNPDEDLAGLTADTENPQPQAGGSNRKQA
jgi:glutamyl-Q tRNA(Asp) synthetase